MLRMFSSPNMTQGVDSTAKLPVTHHALLRHKMYRGKHCFVENMGFYHLSLYRSHWFNDRMEEYSDDLVTRSKNDLPMEHV